METMNQHMKHIWLGDYSHERRSHMATIQAQFDKNVKSSYKSTLSKFHGEINSCKNNLERITAIAAFFEWVSPYQAEIEKYEKSDALSTKFRQIGNQHYKQRKFTDALRAYNLGLNFASTEAQLALCYANRSALALETEPKQVYLALADIQRVELLGSSYPTELLSKLVQRKEKCTRLLHLTPPCDDDESQALSPADILAKADDLQMNLYQTEETQRRKEFCSSQLFKLKNGSKEITAAEDFVKVAVNDERGRHVIVTKDVKPGSVVIVDEAFTKILLKELRWDLEHCHNCHKRTNFGVPCKECAFAYYCNERCRDASFQAYHRYECKTVPILHLFHLPRTAILALRIITQLGPSSLYEQFNKQSTAAFALQHEEFQCNNSETNVNFCKPKAKASTEILGFENGIYNSASYNTIYNLISHPDKLKPTEIISYSLTALSLVTVLERYSSFFENFCQNINNYADENVPRFKNYVASLILLHMQNLPPNAHSLNELQFEPGQGLEFQLTPELIRHATVSEYGAGAFALLSLINHSCVPNVFRINQYAGGKTAVITLATLKAGEELLDNYGVHFAIDHLRERRAHLMTNYYFHCTCIACTYNWPLYADLKNAPEIFTCTLCSGDLNLAGKLVEDFKRQCTIENSRISSNCCLKCGRTFETTPLLVKNLNMKVDQFFTSYNEVLNNKPLEAIESLVEVLEYFESAVLPPFCKTNDTQETLKQALNLIVYYANNTYC